MSDRPIWFRCVAVPFALLVLSVSGLVPKILSQAAVSVAPAEAYTKQDDSLTDQLFPYISGKELPGVATDDLITAASYPLTVASGVPLEDMSSGTTQLIGAALDDNASAVTNIGFDFWFDGVRHSQFSINANGLLRLGSTVVATTFNNSTSGLNTTTNAPKLAPYFEDLCTSSTGQVHYKVVGSAPNRKLIVEWANMQIPRDGSCLGVPDDGVFQVWLFESASGVTPGRIQFVYGGGIGASDDTDLGASIGLQSGVATNFASVTVSDDSVSYTVANNLNLTGITAGKSYIFTPPTPSAAPTGLSFSAVTALSQTLNWTDNSSNEVGFAIFRSTDGTNFTFVGQTAAGAVSFNDIGLLPSTNYSYQVYAVTEGAISSALTGSNSTIAPGNISCNGAGGNWSESATWVGGIVPTSSDNVAIGSGCTVTVDTATAVALDVTIANGGTLQSPTSGTVTTNSLTVGSNVINNGTLDFSTNSNTSGAILTYGPGLPNGVLTGTGAVTDLRALTIAKPSITSIVEVNPTNLTVQGVNTDVAGFLTLTSGTLKISGSFNLTNRFFTAVGYTIPAVAAFWLDNANVTVAGQNGSPTNNGLLRITNGAFNVGTASGNSMGGGAGAQFVFEGGTSNFAGRLQTASTVSYTQSAGTVNVCTVGNTATTACFGLTSTANTFNMTGGSIVLNLPNTNAAPLDYSVSTAAMFVANPAGTTLQLGSGTTPAATTFRVTGATPSLLINAGHSLAVGGGAAGAALFMRGSSVINNGAIVVQGTGTSSRFDFAASGPMTYGGSGTFGTAATPFGGVGMSANGNNTTLNSPIFINRVNFFTGGFINSGQVTLGNAGTSATVVQVGNSTTPTDAGGFDVLPTYNSGSGGHILLHLRTNTLNRVVGLEMNPTRNLNAFTFDNNIAGATLSLGAGNVTISGTGAGSLGLTNGVVNVNSGNTLFHNAGTVTRTTGYVNGALSRNFTAAAAYTYHVGQNGYSPVAANVTAGTGDLSVTAVGTVQPNIPNPAKALSRHWKLTGAGVTSDLVFSYLDPADIPGTATESAFVIQKYDGTFSQPGGTVDTTANTASITGVTSFSDWTLAEPGSLTAPGVLALSSSTYSANENAGTVSVTVNRTSGTDGAVNVDFAFSGGTATGGASCSAGIDYVNTGGTVSFANGESTKNFNVTLCGDTDVEPDETFNVTLSNATGGATIGSPGSATVTILNDDVAGGAVTVTASAGAPSGTYATLTLAIAAVNDGTHQGNVVINVNQTTSEPGTIVLNGSGAGAASYTSLLIRPTGDAITVAGASVQGRGLIELNGADNVTIDGDNPNSAGTNRNLTLQNTAANTVTFTSVIRIALAATIVTSADGNTFKNLNILGSATGRNIGTATTTTGTENNGFGIFSGPGASTVSATTPPAAVTSVSTGAPAGSTATNLVVSNNSVTTAARAISINAAAATIYPGLQITGNSVGNPTAGAADGVYAVGINASGSADGLIAGNTVHVEGYVPSSAAGHGIAVGVTGAFRTFTIENNKVNRVRNNNVGTWSALGINLGGSSKHVVRNKFVSGVINNLIAGT